MARSRPSRNTAARRLAAGAAFLLLALGGVPAHAQEKPRPAEPPARAETKHTITLAGRHRSKVGVEQFAGLQLRKLLHRQFTLANAHATNRTPEGRGSFSFIRQNARKSKPV